VDGAICTAVLSLARSLGLSVTAEGVETEEQRDWLARHGCDEIQGFLVSRAVPAVEIERRYGHQTGLFSTLVG
jgi:EAL domain-containing protein (putative c-di-GMP-specific phosphodiesterase class I)